MSDKYDIQAGPLTFFTSDRDFSMIFGSLIGALLFWSILTGLSTVIVWWGSILLERSSERLSLWYGLPPIVHGSLVVAVGSSFPEISSTVLATLIHGKFNLGIGAVVGSAIFNLLVIPGVSGLYAGGLSVDLKVVYKEAQFYMIAVSVLLITLAFAVIYFPVKGEFIQGSLNRQLVMIPIGLYAVYIFTQQQETTEYEPEPLEQSINPILEWFKLIAGLLVIAVGVEALLRAAIAFGDLLNTPDFLWGLTMIAAATSLPDLLISVRAAGVGKGVTSLSNVLGSNTFDLLVAVPAGILVAGEATVNFSAAVPMMGFLTLGTIIVFVLTRTQLKLSFGESLVLLGTYGIFIIWMVLEAMELMNLVPGR